MGRRDTFSKGARYEWPRWSAAPGSFRSEWYLRAFRRGCDYGGSGQVLRAALWYHSVRFRHHCVVVARLLCLQFCVLVPAAATRPVIPAPDLSICALPSSLHPSPLPPAPPFQGGAGGGELGGGDSDEPDACSGIWREVVDGAAWLQLRGAAGTYLLASRAVHHPGDQGWRSLASPWDQEICRWCTCYLL